MYFSVQLSGKDIFIIPESKYFVREFNIRGLT